MKQQKFSKRRSQRGAAMVEGVVVLPIFVILFAGVFYVRSMIIERQQLDTLARSCAWRYAANGCTDTPVGCEADGLLSKEKFENQSEGWVKSSEEELTDAIKVAGDSEEKVAEAVLGIISRALAEAFTEAATASPSVTRTAPQLFGGEEKVLQSHFQIACNLRPVTASSIAIDAWKGLVKNDKKDK